MSRNFTINACSVQADRQLASLAGSVRGTVAADSETDALDKFATANYNIAGFDLAECRQHVADHFEAIEISA